MKHKTSKLLLLMCLFVNFLEGQDRLNNLNITYPSELYYHNGGRVIDVTKSPFNAKGDGVTDDTEAIKSVYNFIADQYRNYDKWSDVDLNYIIYFPEGEYLVSNTLIYDGDRLSYASSREDGIFNIRLVGQSRDNTIIRLADNTEGFEGTGNKYLVCFQKPGKGTNIPGKNELRNLTINTGSGNSGASGVYFLSANTGVISDVLIKSEDGSGNAGIEFPTLSVQGSFNDITVQGFDIGIYIKNGTEVQPSLEHITLTGQNITGIEAKNGCPSIRKLLSINEVAALELSGPSTQTIIVDSDFSSSSGESAIKLKNENARLFVRNLVVNGYTNSIEEFDGTVYKGNIEEYYSDNSLVLNGNKTQSTLNTHIMESPVYKWPEDTSEWVLVDTCSGSNDLDKLETALNSGKSTIWFGKKLKYNLSGRIAIPASVRFIMGNYSLLSINFTFDIAESSDDTLFMYNMFDRIKVVHQSSRTLLLRHASASYQNEQSDSVLVFLESVANIGADENFCPPGTHIFSKGLNDENKSTSNFKIYGGSFWGLGYKTEGHQSSFDVRHGGICEVLGGYRNETGSDEGMPTVLNDNSNVSYIGFTNMCGFYELAVVEIDGMKADSARNQNLPERVNDCASSSDYFVPVYSRYDSGLFSGVPHAYFLLPRREVTYYTPSGIIVEVRAVDRDGGIDSVEFFLDGQSMGTDTDASDGWSLQLSNVEEGVRELQVLVTDNEGNANYSRKQGLNVIPLPPSEMTGYWKLNGDAVNEVSGIHGKPSSELKFSGGFFGQAARFDGDSKITIDDVVMTNDSGSISLWFNTTQDDDHGMMFYTAEEGSNGNGYGEERELHINMRNTDEKHILMYYLHGDTRAQWSSSDAINDGDWHHVVLNWNNNGNCWFYLDNVFLNSHFFKDQKTFFGDILLGNTSSGQRAYEGLLDEVRVYNFVLSEDSINGLYHEAFDLWLNINDGAEFPNQAAINLALNTFSEVDSVTFLIDGFKEGSDDTSEDGWNIEWMPNEPGEKLVIARAYFDGSEIGSVQARIVIVNNLPLIDFISPNRYSSVKPDQNGILLEVETSDEDGRVDSVRFYIDKDPYLTDIDGNDGFSVYYQPQEEGRFYFQAEAFDNDGGSVLSEEYYAFVTSLYTNINENPYNNIIIYPNPARTYLQIDAGEHSLSRLEVYSLEGRLIRSMKFSKQKGHYEMNIQNLEEGLYFIKVSSENGSVFSKFIKRQ